MAGYSKQEGLGPSPFGWVPPGCGCGAEGAVAGAELRHFYCERTVLLGSLARAACRLMSPLLGAVSRDVAGCRLGFALFASARSTYRGGVTGGVRDGRVPGRGDSGTQPVPRLTGRALNSVMSPNSSTRVIANLVACSHWAATRRASRMPKDSRYAR